MKATSIEWTDFSTNPLKYRDSDGRVVWACVHASPGCVNCYAEGIANRYQRGGPFTLPTTARLTPFLDEVELHRMLTYKPASGKKCFPFDMTDLFGEWVPDDLIDHAFAVMALRADVTWQLLTKRADRMLAYFERWHGENRQPNSVGYYMHQHAPERFEDGTTVQIWPPPNVWLGVSVENQHFAELRVPLLTQIPAAVRFISYEPALGPVDLTDIEVMEHHFDALRGEWCSKHSGCLVDDKGDGEIDWVIVGGESGPNARPCDLAWIRNLQAQCLGASVPLFIKQLGARPYDSYHLVGTWAPEDKRTPKGPDGAGGQMALGNILVLNNRKGGDMTQFPSEFRQREYPPEEQRHG